MTDHAAPGPTAAESVLLTLVFPALLEESVVAELLAHPDSAKGFTLMRCEGHGASAVLTSVDERVRGRSARLMVQLVLGAEASDRVLATLASRFASADVHTWRMPLVDTGRLGDFAPR